VLEHLRLVQPNGTVAVTLQEPGREPITLVIPLAEQQPARLRVREALGITPPLYASGPEQAKYWYRYVSDSQTLFVQYNDCENDRKQSFADFTRALLTEVQPRPLQRVVVDLRWNGGGDSRVIRPLKQALAGPLAGKPLYVFIGPETFSSALMNAMELKRERKAVLVGEATGGTPKGYGEVKRLVLPHSQVAVRYTSKFFAVPKKFDVPSLLPDLPAPILFRDVLAGRDPAMAAVLAASS
jgi:hypothetical protein